MDQYPRQYLYLQIVRAKLFIDENFDKAIDLERIADAACFSKFHFVRTFRSIYGRTPHQYLTQVRIDRSKELLASGETVAAACFKVGFDSVTSFFGLFKRRVGQTPRQYQVGQSQIKEAVAAKPLAYIPGCFAEKKGWK